MRPFGLPNNEETSCQGTRAMFPTA
jgi:hypothetical protein